MRAQQQERQEQEERQEETRPQTASAQQGKQATRDLFKQQAGPNSPEQYTSSPALSETSSTSNRACWPPTLPPGNFAPSTNDWLSLVLPAPATLNPPSVTKERQPCWRNKPPSQPHCAEQARLGRQGVRAPLPIPSMLHGPSPPLAFTRKSETNKQPTLAQALRLDANVFFDRRPKLFCRNCVAFPR